MIKAILVVVLVSTCSSISFRVGVATDEQSCFSEYIGS